MSHAAYAAHLAIVNREVAAALARCRALGVPVTVQLAGLHDQLREVRVVNTPLAELVAYMDRHPLAAMDEGEAAQLVRDRVAQGWPADGLPLHQRASG